MRMEVCGFGCTKHPLRKLCEDIKLCTRDGRLSYEISIFPSSRNLNLLRVHFVDVYAPNQRLSSSTLFTAVLYKCPYLANLYELIDSLGLATAD